MDQMTSVNIERRFPCPRCWERQAVVLDLSVEGEQRFAQDCTVCCNPIEFTVTVCNGELTAFSIDRLEK